MRENCREHGDEDADGERGARGPGRHPAPRGSYAEHDRADHQQQPEAGGAWTREARVVSVRDVDAHGPDGQGQGEEGGRLHVVRHSGCHVEQCDQQSAAKSSPNHERAMRFE
jgi:hypothetical protein